MQKPRPYLYPAPEPGPLQLMAAELREDDEPRWRSWLVFLGLVLLLHFIVMLAHVDWLVPSRPAAPVEVQELTPQQIEAIRKRVQNQPRGLVKPNASTPHAKEAPDHARYMSDRNIKVEKEQQARNNAVPQIGAVGVPTPQSQGRQAQSAKPKTQAPSKGQPIPKLSLGNLGLSYHFDRAPKTPTQDEADRSNEETTPQRPMAGNGGGGMLDDKVPNGSQTMLNAEESVYYSFYSRLYDAILPIWSSRARQAAYQVRPRPGDYVTVADVILDRAGHLMDVKIVHASGIHEFDQAVDSSWRKIGNFPNPPAGLLNAQGEVHVTWEFLFRVEDGVVQFMPPERVE